MGFFNSGGLLTRGFGDDHRIVTRGMSVRFDFGGIGFRKRYKKFDLDILAPIIKENFDEILIYSPLEIKKESDRSITSSISKEVEEDINLLIGIDYSLLDRVLDAI